MSVRDAIPRRRSIRLREYDYTQPGAYFVTICTDNRESLFGEVIDGEMRLNDFGRIVEEEWLRTSSIRPELQLDAFVIMPNHAHAILIRNEPPDAKGEGPGGRAAGSPLRIRAPMRPKGVAPGSLGVIIGQFKSIVAKRINEARGTPGAPVWQRNYYEHVIRNDNDLESIRAYIAGNPGRWWEDEENPERVAVMGGAVGARRRLARDVRAGGEGTS